MDCFPIRVSNNNDFDKIFDIRIENQGPVTSMQFDPSQLDSLKADFFRLYFETRGSIIFVAESPQNEILGWQALVPFLSNPLLGKHMAQSSTYVCKNWQNKKIGNTLFEFSRVKAKESGVEQMYSRIAAENKISNYIIQKYNLLELEIPAGKNSFLPNFKLYVDIFQ